MKNFILILLLLVPSMSVEACLCNGITAATCATAPCTIQCGLCREHCCQFPFGRNFESSENSDRWLLPCFSGRKSEDTSLFSSRAAVDPGKINIQLNKNRERKFQVNFGQN